jgi:hypothetical protein
VCAGPAVEAPLTARWRLPLAVQEDRDRRRTTMLVARLWAGRWARI